MIQKFNLSDNFLEFFHENGFCVITGVENRYIEAVSTGIMSVLGVGYTQSEIDIRRRITAVRDDADWTKRSKRMWDTLGLLQFYSSDFIKSILLQLQVSNPIWSTRPEVRIDFPEDEVFSQPWHQDFMYSQTSLNSVTFWLPLHDVGKSDGALQVVPCSHREKLFPFSALQNPRRFSIDERIFENRNVVDLEMKAGEVVVFSQFLAHRSGTNISDAVRVSVQGRFADMSCSFFKNGNFETTSCQNLDLLRRIE
jgi:hypothetical protein